MCKGGPSNDLISFTNFNHGLLQAVREGTPSTDNFVASPVSALVLLSALLVANGPRGNTAVEICKAVSGRGFNSDCERGNFKSVEDKLEQIRRAVESARSKDGKPIMTLSNAAFFRQDFRVSNGFIQRFAMLSSDHVATVDFTTSDAFEKINKWVDETTGGLIKRLFNNEGEIDADTILMLLNAVTFKASWLRQFTKTSTQEAIFYLQNGSPVSIPMMKHEENMVLYSKDTNSYKFIAKPFETPRFKFVVAMPQSSNLKKLEKDIEGDFPWSEVDNNDNLEQVNLVLPRFKVEDDIDMTPLLKRLGIQDLFTRGIANLTGISHEGSLYASSSKQVAVMEVDEYGVKAAAVTSMAIMPMSLPPPPVDFIVNKPFYCAIYDSELKMPLFVARVMDPR